MLSCFFFFNNIDCAESDEQWILPVASFCVLHNYNVIINRRVYFFTEIQNKISLKQLNNCFVYLFLKREIRM